MKPDLSFPLENAGWPAFLVESGGTIRHANQAAHAFFGAKLEGEGLSLSALFADAQVTAEQFLARCERSAAAVVPLRYQGKGGLSATFATYICRVRDVQQRYLFQLIRTEDLGTGFLTDLARLGVAGAKPGPGDTTVFQKQKLDCAMQLARSVALDFNNVLTSILGHASFVLAQLENQHPLHSSLVEIEKAAGRAAELTQQLAAFSRPEKEMPAHASGNLNAVLRRLVDRFQKTQPSVRWQTHLEEHLYTVRFDESKIEQGLARILDNAVEAVGERGRVSISSRNLDITEPTQDRTARLLPGCHVCLEITDDGKGIEPDALPRIFEPFYTTKHGHRGFGLVFVYGVMTNHGGAVAVSSEPRQGTSVRVYLPALPQVVPETAMLKCDVGPRRTILLVDDEELVLDLGRTVLTSSGYQVLTASSGPKALELLGQAPGPIDLIITDLTMPQMSGHEFIEQLQVRLPDVPILRTSGIARQTAEDHAPTYLQKPFTSQVLVRRVKQLLQPDPPVSAP